MRTCPKCGVEKEERFFPVVPPRSSINVANINGSLSWHMACKACHARHARVLLHAGDYDSIFIQQNGRCKACGELPDPNGRRFARDVDDKAWLFRGLVHHRCNVVIGIARDNPMYLRSLADYLEHAHDHRVIQPTLEGGDA
jgi:Recombination endonuclease VII